MIKLHKIDGFYKVLWWCPQVNNEFKEHEINPTPKSLRSWNVRP